MLEAFVIYRLYKIKIIMMTIVIIIIINNFNYYN